MRNLRSEQEIMANWKGDPSQPVVSICCTTFNHESYIEDALEGFLIQETDFPFEILIHDDASTDRTADIIREYEAAYPTLIKPIYQTENQYSQGKRPNPEFNFPRARGEYIAICEGDDYWIVSLKLQNQVDFLENNSEYSMCFHNAKLLIEDNRINKSKTFSNLKNQDYNGEDIYSKWIVPTASVVFRSKNFINHRVIMNPDFLFGDIILFLSLAETGKIRCINECMSVYRIHKSGITADKSIKKKLKVIRHHLAVQKSFEGKYKGLSNDTISNCYLNICKQLLCDKNINLKLFRYTFLAIKYSPSNIFQKFKSKLLKTPHVNVN